MEASCIPLLLGTSLNSPLNTGLVGFAYFACSLKALLPRVHLSGLSRMHLDIKPDRASIADRSVASRLQPIAADLAGLCPTVID